VDIVDIAAVSISCLAAFISFLALAFTIFSFYWMNLRKGKLIVGKPTTYAAVAQKELLIVQLPLVFYNDGAATRIVSDLRLRLEQDGRAAPMLYFNNTVEDLGPKDLDVKAEGRKWARQFAVKGHDGYASVFVFQRSPKSFQFLAGTCEAKLEGKLDKKDTWEVMLAFDLHIRACDLSTLHSNRLIPYSNDPSREE
jgi:hypothetical protein